MLDGEGTFFLVFSTSRSRNQPSFLPQITITLNEREVFLLEELRKALKGRTLWHDKKRHAFTLKVTAKETVRFIIKNLFPYLKLKQQQAELLLQAIDIMDKVKRPHARDLYDILNLAEIRDKMHDLSSGKRPKQRKWTYDAIKEYATQRGYGTKEREERRFKRYKESGISTRFRKGCVPWNKNLRYQMEDASALAQKTLLGS